MKYTQWGINSKEQEKRAWGPHREGASERKVEIGKTCIFCVSFRLIFRMF